MQTLSDFQSKYCCAEYSSLIVMFNDHAGGYETTSSEHFSVERLTGYATFPSDEEFAKAMTENSVWTIQWYPRTPVGFICVGASTFERALEYAYEVAKA